MPATDAVVRFAIDPKATLFTVQAFASGIASAVAHSPKFAMRELAGTAQFVPGSLKDASINLTVDVAGLDIMDEVSRNDRREIERIMFDEVLEKSHYPRVIYKSSRVVSTKTADNMYRLNVAGDLNLHGTTRGVGLDVNIVTGEDTLRAQGTFTLLQSDYGISMATVAGGAIKLKDELRFSYFVIARRE